MELAELKAELQGSECYTVTPNSEGFTFKAANDSEECRQAFHELVERARKNPRGYMIVPNRSGRDLKGRWDFALITVDARYLRVGPFAATFHN